MTDDTTRQTDSTPPPEPATPSAEPAPAEAEPAWSATAATSPDVADPVAAAPVAAAAGPSRARWFVALGVVALAAIVAIGAFTLLSSQPTPEALKYVPGDAVMVVELRPELPGDQMQNLGTLLAHFPGFLDQSTLTQKLDQAFTQLLAQMGDAGLDYATDVKPWMSGPAFIAVRKVAGDNSDGLSGPAGFILSATTNGQVTCATALADRPTTSETYNGTELLLMAGTEYGCVVQGKQGLLGDRLSLRAALDAKSGGNGMDKSEKYAAARRSITGDQLSTIYIDGDAITAMMRSMLPDDNTGGAPISGLESLGFGGLPSWSMSGIRAEGDALVIDTVAPTPAPVAGGPSLLPAPPAHASLIAPLVPADALLYAEAQGTGVTLLNFVNQLRSVPEFEQQFQMLEGMVEIEGLVNWIDDAGIVVTGGETPAGGLILIAKDEASANEKSGAISTLIGLAGLGGQGIEVDETDVNGVKVTNLTITDVSALLPPGSVPGIDPSTTGPIQLSYAVRGRALMFGSGEAFLTRLLGVPAGGALLDQAAFKAAGKYGSATSVVTVYLAVPGIISTVEGFIPAAELDEWTTELKPYIAPLDAVYVSSSTDGGMSRSTFVLSVKPQ